MATGADAAKKIKAADIANTDKVLVDQKAPCSTREKPSPIACKETDAMRPPVMQLKSFMKDSIHGQLRWHLIASTRHMH